MDKNAASGHDSDVVISNVPPPMYDVFSDFVLSSTGGLEFVNQEHMKRQRKLIWEFMKLVGKNLFKGSLFKISMPVGLCEPRSFLERLTDQWSYAPLLLTPAARRIDDPVARFKGVIAFVVAGIHLTCRMDKPFNPILGETFQACFDDGTELYLEQTSHHPPVSHWDIRGPDKSYRFYGHGESFAKTKPNSMICGFSSVNVIEFPDGSVISFSMPMMRISGVVMGTRLIEYLGEIRFEDQKNDLVCTLELVGDSSRGGFWAKKGTQNSDCFSGDIRRDHHFKLVAGRIETIDDEDERTPARRHSIRPTGDALCQVSGAWTSHIAFDGQRMWDIKQDKGQTPRLAKDSLLLSDSRYRSDRFYVAQGDLKIAHDKKVELEQIQRNDRKLRSKGGKNSAGDSVAAGIEDEE